LFDDNPYNFSVSAKGNKCPIDINSGLAFDSRFNESSPNGLGLTLKDIKIENGID